MTARIDGGGLASETEELADERHGEAAEELNSGDDDEHRSHAPLPWIGALSNPRVGPMVAINDNGYLIPLCTAGDLLRGCKYFWRSAQD